MLRLLKFLPSVALVLPLALGACGSSDDADNSSTNPSSDQAGAGNGSQTPTGGELSSDVDWTAWNLVYSPMYSAYDGVQTFQVPVYVNNTAVPLEGWQAIPADAVSFDLWQSEDMTQTGVLITVLKPEPVVTIAASSGGLGGKTELYITEADPSLWEIGRERYQNGASFEVGDFTMTDLDLSNIEVNFQTGEVTIVNADAEAFGNPTDLRCDTCHTEGAENFQIQHTPTQAARFSDEELMRIFMEGIKPEGVGYRVLPPFVRSFYQYFHTWQVSEEQARGLVIYLRSLTPKGQGDILLDGILMPPEGFMGFGGGFPGFGGGTDMTDMMTDTGGTGAMTDAGMTGTGDAMDTGATDTMDTGDTGMVDAGMGTDDRTGTDDTTAAVDAGVGN